MSQKGPRKRLVVVINNRTLTGTATDVYVEALCEMGLERVAHLNMTLGGQPLVSEKPSARAYRQCGSWYVATHSDTAEKHSVLERLQTRLALDMQIRLTEVKEELLSQRRNVSPSEPHPLRTCGAAAD